MRERELNPAAADYDEAFESYRWHVPEFYNIAEDTCDRHAEHPVRAGTTALFYEDEAGYEARYTFAELRGLSDRLALALAAQGLGRGERMAVLMPQRPETAIAHLAAYKLGAVAVPLTVLFRHDALLFRLADSGARAIVLEAESLPLLEQLLPELPELKTVVVTGQVGAWRGGAELLDFWQAIENSEGNPRRVKTRADDPALLVYTSGTTGNPKGALHAHRYLIGHLPGFEFAHNFTPQPGDCFWTPADWAWVGGLLDILLAAWHYGLPVVAYKSGGPFDPEKALYLMEKYKVRNAFIPPTALKMMAQAPDIPSRYKLHLRSMMSGGEALGAETLQWAEDQLGVKVNELYGQTEINLIVGNCQRLWPATPGSMGRALPGHRVAVVDDAGNPLPAGELGEIAVLRGEDPVFFLEYWNNPQGTADKYIGDWALTGDLAVQDEQGNFWFKGRKDDVIISAGYRIGPTEIEESLLKHPAVALSAAIASPDQLRGNVVKAFVKTAPGYQPCEELAREIQEFVKENLARHEYPREIEFIEDFPLTTTGKIRRNELRLRDLERKQPLE
ncbi:MAG: AMP-binding protein [SAR324 cluster bacterium]|nr:AMP-binding protein [SAR324 cluster bacterium]MCZ6841431.1 AMP-binding protein [SAR324 cluster bacterium]